MLSLLTWMGVVLSLLTWMVLSLLTWMGVVLSLLTWMGVAVERSLLLARGNDYTDPPWVPPPLLKRRPDAAAPGCHS